MALILLFWAFAISISKNLKPLFTFLLENTYRFIV